MKDAIDNKPCRAPSVMSDEELETELLNRGKEVKGTRDQMIETLTALDRGCIIVSVKIVLKLSVTLQLCNNARMLYVDASHLLVPSSRSSVKVKY